MPHPARFTLVRTGQHLGRLRGHQRQMPLDVVVPAEAVNNAIDPELAEVRLVLSPLVPGGPVRFLLARLPIADIVENQHAVVRNGGEETRRSILLSQNFIVAEEPALHNPDAVRVPGQNALIDGSRELGQLFIAVFGAHRSREFVAGVHKIEFRRAEGFMVGAEKALTDFLVPIGLAGMEDEGLRQAGHASCSCQLVVNVRTWRDRPA